MKPLDENAERTFAYLPLELRLDIWELAVPDYYAKPQVHFFSIGEGQDCHLETEGNPAFATRSNFRPPLMDKQVESFRDTTTEPNLSAYCQVSGLWNACQESRAVLQNISSNGTNTMTPRSETMKVVGPLRLFFQAYQTSGMSLRDMALTCFASDPLILG